MTDQILLNDFSAGWCPSDDPINGRKNGLVRMDNLDLGKNGILKISNGTVRNGTVFTNTLHSAARFTINATAYNFSADTTGLVFRDNTQIATGGSTVRAAFVAAFNYVFGFSGDKRFKDTGAATTDLGIIKPSAAPTLAATAGSLTGDYEYCQINVLVNGAYQAKSARGPIGTITLAAQGTTVTPQNPSAVSSTGNEAWIFRRGVNLDTWYRIARVTSFGSFTDNMSDSDALLLGITMNDYLLAINSTDTPDAILAAVGPVYNRLIYFTAKQIIPSDINSPDSYDSRTVINFGSSAGAEVFKWAIKVKPNVILVGTSMDVYILSGTFIQLPDGYLDMACVPLGVDNAPIGIGVAIYGNLAIYLSRSGWVACNTSGDTILLTPPNTDRLYAQETNADYGPPSFASTVVGSCVVIRNKLFCVVLAQSGSSRVEIYDFLRKYWRVAYVGVCPDFLFLGQGQNVFGFDNADKFQKVYDAPTTKVLDDGSATKQAIAFRTCFVDDGKPRNKKDIFTLTLRGHTGSASIGVTVKIAFDGLTSFTTLSPAFIQLTTGEQSWDISGATNGTTDPGTLPKCIQVDISGSPPDFELQDISISYSARPEGQLHLNLLDLGLDTVNKSMVASLNFLIDTHGQDVKFYPVIDGTIQVSKTFNTTKPARCSWYTAAISTGYNITGFFIAQTTTPFEFYKQLAHTNLFSYPELRIHSVGGPFELFRYGKLKKIILRVQPSATTIYYNLKVDDTVVISDTALTVVINKDQIIEIGVPKTIAGSIMFFNVFSGAGEEFRTYSIIAQYAKSGGETEEKYLPLFADNNEQLK